MRTATGLMLIALGAILAFAVNGHPSWLNIQIVGWVIMLTGTAGMLLPRRGYGWLRRRIVLRRGPGGRPVVNRVDEQHYPPYVMLNPGAITDDDHEPADAGSPTLADPPPAAGPQQPADWEAAEQAVAEWRSADEAAAPGEPRPAEEVVEEYVEE